MSPTGLDQSWSRTDPSIAKSAGVQVISGYLSYSSSKNWSATWIKKYHAVGIAALINWESQAGAPLNGASQGRTDATVAVNQLRVLISAVGYKPKNRLVIYFSCDRDVNSSQYGQIDAYYRAAKAVCNAAGFGVGVYGEASLVSHLHKAGITDAEWQTYAWSGGVLSPDADFYQYHNGQTLGGASVDFNKVIHPDSLGAWWPPNNTHNQPVTPAVVDPLEQIMSWYANKTEFENAIQHRAGVGVLWNTDWKNELGKGARMGSFIQNIHARTVRLEDDNAALKDQLTAMQKQLTTITTMLSKPPAQPTPVVQPSPKATS